MVSTVIRSVTKFGLARNGMFYLVNVMPAFQRSDQTASFSFGYLEPTTHIGIYVENQRLQQWLSIRLFPTHSHDYCHAILVDKSKWFYVKHFKSYSVKFGSWYVFSWNNDQTTICTTVGYV